MTANAHYDVVIVGAGISGVGAAYHLKTQCPTLSFIVLEEKESFGGTWLTHRYPGIRSDSDLHTYGYRFKPWTGPPIATAAEILAYMGRIIEENGLEANIRYGHKVSAASWSSEDRLWTLYINQADTGLRTEMTAKFLWMCQGYYRHCEGYTPRWNGLADFRGQVVHPQNWPRDIQYAGKNVVVVGSGATAATIIPAIARDCAHVTMLQRSPTYFWAGRYDISIADELRRLQIPEEWIHEIVRKKIIHDHADFIRRTWTEPVTVREELLSAARSYLGPDFDIETHFGPRYRPWQQRLAIIPDGDLYRAIADGKTTVVTDEIEAFTASGITLKSKRTLAADVIVTATGFNLNILGDIDFTIAGRPLNLADTVTYRGMMFTGVPNLVWVFGYFRYSWTLRLDLVADFVCRLLQLMTKTGARSVVPALRREDRDMPLLPWIDPDDFSPGYLMRSSHLLPRRGAKREWQHTQDYWTEKDEFPAIDLDDAAFVYA